MSYRIQSHSRYHNIRNIHCKEQLDVPQLFKFFKQMNAILSDGYNQDIKIYSILHQNGDTKPGCEINFALVWPDCKQNQ